MNTFSRFYMIVMLLFAGKAPVAQNITGTWETYRNEEFMQFNIEQRNNELCGYSYDYELYDKESYCIADFVGRYDEAKKIWYFTGTGFIENSGTHVLMRIILWSNKNDAKNILRGKVFLQSSPNTIFGMGGDDIIVKKVSNEPVKLRGRKPCFPPQPLPAPIKKIPPKQASPKLTPLKPVPAKPIKPKPAKPIPVPKLKPDTLRQEPKSVAPTTSKNERIQLINKMSTRKRVEQSRVQINVNKLNLKLYDNGTVDDDTISIFYNGRLLLSHQRLSEKAIELDIELDTTTSIHEITMYAENLGSIVPNTALVVVTAGSKRFELRSRSNLEENSVLVFEYKPRP